MADPKEQKEPEAEEAFYSERLSIRISKPMREVIEKLCETEKLPPVDVMRYAMEAGIMLAQRHGIGPLMSTRSEFLAGPYPPPARRGAVSKPKKKKK